MKLTQKDAGIELLQGDMVNDEEDCAGVSYSRIQVWMMIVDTTGITRIGT